VYINGWLAARSEWNTDSWLWQPLIRIFITNYFTICSNLIVLCAVGCYWNVSTPNHIVTQSGVIEITCEVHHADRRRTPVIQCLPETSTDVVSHHYSSRGTLRYSKMVTVTSRMNNVTFDCHLSFVAESSSISNNYSPVHLWTSPVINVKCKFRLQPLGYSAKISLSLVLHFDIWHLSTTCPTYQPSFPVTTSRIFSISWQSKNVLRHTVYT